MITLYTAVRRPIFLDESSASLKLNIVFKGTVARNFVADFFIPIDRPDLGDGLLKGVKFVRCTTFTEQRAFYALIRMLKRGTNAQFRYENRSPRGSKFTPTPRACSLRGCNFEVQQELLSAWE